MQKVAIKEFLRQAVSLEAGDVINFFIFPGPNGDGEEYYGITRFDAFEASHLVANYYGGGDPFVYDFTVYDSNLDEICEAFAEWLASANEDDDTDELFVFIESIEKKSEEG